MRAVSVILLAAWAAAACACDYKAYTQTLSAAARAHEQCMYQGYKCDCLAILIDSYFGLDESCPGVPSARASLMHAKATCEHPPAPYFFGAEQQQRGQAGCDLTAFREDRRRAFRSPACSDPARQCECIKGIQTSYTMNAACPGALQDARQLERSIDAACDEAPVFLRGSL